MDPRCIGILIHILLACMPIICAARPENQPQGIHLSLGHDPFVDRIVMFTSQKPIQTFTLLDPNDANQGVMNNFNTTSSPLNVTGDSKKKYWIQVVNITNLEADMKYTYRVGTGSTSSRWNFRTWAKRNEYEHYQPLNFLFYGNIDSKGQIPSDLLMDTMSHHYHAIVNLGSLACSPNLTYFLNNLQSLSGNLPLLTTPGPFESQHLYQLYSQLFAMPKSGWPMKQFWYSFDTEKAHIVSIDTQLYTDKAKQLKELQMQWLKKDLKAANEGSKRSLENRPWIIVFTHGSLYCSGDLECTDVRHRLKELEYLFFNNGVDLIISAQDNYYERTWPVYMELSHENSYSDPTYPVYVSTASFTCNKSKPSIGKIHHWSALRKDCRGSSTYGLLSILNSTHLRWSEKNGTGNVEQEIDTFFVVQRHHGPFTRHASHSDEVIAIVVTCLVLLVIGAIVILFWSRGNRFCLKKRAERNMRYVHLNEGQLEL